MISLITNLVSQINRIIYSPRINNISLKTSLPRNLRSCIKTRLLTKNLFLPDTLITQRTRRKMICLLPSATLITQILFLGEISSLSRTQMNSTQLISRQGNSNSKIHFIMTQIAVTALIPAFSRKDNDTSLPSPIYLTRAGFRARRRESKRSPSL